MTKTVLWPMQSLGLLGGGAVVLSGSVCLLCLFCPVWCFGNYYYYHYYYNVIPALPAAW